MKCIWISGQVRRLLVLVLVTTATGKVVAVQVLYLLFQLIVEMGKKRIHTYSTSIEERSSSEWNCVDFLQQEASL